MSIVFVAAGPISWASSRIRCHWPARYMEGTRVVQAGERLPDADIYIWQKKADLAAIRRLGHAVHIWDVCDPSWWWEPGVCAEIAGAVDHVVASSQALARDFTEWATGKLPAGVLEVDTIPDRIEMDHFPQQRGHRGADPVRFVWYGIAANRAGLNAAFANLERLAANGYRIELTVLDDRPDVQVSAQRFPVYHTRWELDKENEIIAAHDVALLPKYPGPWGVVKSNNKDLTAWACGLPVARGTDYRHMVQLMDAEYRRAVADAGWATLHERYLAEQSAREWEAVLA